jgi:hypothetical protein
MLLGLRKALSVCALSLVVACLLWGLSAFEQTRAQTQRDHARADVQKMTMQIATARETEAAREARTKRFAVLKTMLEARSQTEAELEKQLRQRLSGQTGISSLVISVSSASPAFPAAEGIPVMKVCSVQVEAGVLHEEMLFTINNIVTAPPLRMIPKGCAVHRKSADESAALWARCEFDWVVLGPSADS